MADAGADGATSPGTASAGAGPDADRTIDQLRAIVDPIRAELDLTHRAREQALPACRRAIRAAGSSIRAVHRLEPARAADLADESEVAIREAQQALVGFPQIAYAGFLHDAEKEFVEARMTAILVEGGAIPTPADLAVAPVSWVKGLAEAASELRRHLLDRLRAGDLAKGEELLGVMDDVYDALVVIDYPDAISGGLRRTLDALRAVLERTRGDVTTTVLQAQLQHAIESTR
jgi:translin